MNLRNENNFLFTKDSRSSYQESNNFPKLTKSKIFITHKIIDGINISLLISIFILSFLSFNSQRKWTNFYSIMKNIRSINNHLVDYISITEEFYIFEIDKLDNIKKTTSKDLIYITNNIKKQKSNKFNQLFFNLRKGIQEGKYQRGNL